MIVELTEAERTKIIYLLTNEIDYLITRINSGTSKYQELLQDSLKVVVTAANKLSSTERAQEN